MTVGFIFIWYQDNLMIFGQSPSSTDGMIPSRFRRLIVSSHFTVSLGPSCQKSRNYRSRQKGSTFTMRIDLFGVNLIYGLILRIREEYSAA